MISVHIPARPHEMTLTTTYPTNSLQFLQKLTKPVDFNKKSDPLPSQVNVQLNITIVGAGLGGLATAIALARHGHSVTVLEQAQKLGEVGAGIQIPSNSGLLLERWGVSPFLSGKISEPEGMTFRRWEDGSPIGYTKLVPDFRENFKSSYKVIHRADFHDALYQRALQLGVQIRVNCKVVSYDPEAPSVELDDGRCFFSDLIIAADGVKSVARQHVLSGLDRKPEQTGFAVYRATVDVTKIAVDPEISWLLQKPALNVWIGENRHVMTYTIGSGKSFNMVLSHVDKSDPSTWKADSAITDMRNEFSGWDPSLTKIINMIDKTIKWPLVSGSRLPTWIAPSSKILILGDAAHAMVPYMSQGAAMAVEDGAGLATVLSLVHDRSTIPFALRVFEKERIKRTSQMQDASLVNGLLWHFRDGPEQRARDAAMLAETEGRPFLSSSNQWSDPVTQWWAYGYDAEAEMKQAWNAAVDDVVRKPC